MSKGKSILLELALLSAMMSQTKIRSANDISHGIPDEKPKVIPNGCKEYTFNGFTVVAISEKSARKKCAKLAAKVKW